MKHNPYHVKLHDFVDTFLKPVTRIEQNEIVSRIAYRKAILSRDILDAFNSSVPERAIFKLAYIGYSKSSNQTFGYQLFLIYEIDGKLYRLVILIDLPEISFKRWYTARTPYVFDDFDRINSVIFSAVSSSGSGLGNIWDLITGQIYYDPKCELVLNYQSVSEISEDPLGFGVFTYQIYRKGDHILYYRNSKYNQDLENPSVYQKWKIYAKSKSFRK